MKKRTHSVAVTHEDDEDDEDDEEEGAVGEPSTKRSRDDAALQQAIARIAQDPARAAHVAASMGQGATAAIAATSADAVWGTSVFNPEHAGFDTVRAFFCNGDGVLSLMDQRSMCALRATSRTMRIWVDEFGIVFYEQVIHAIKNFSGDMVLDPFWRFMKQADTDTASLYTIIDEAVTASIDPNAANTIVRAIMGPFNMLYELGLYASRKILWVDVPHTSIDAVKALPSANVYLALMSHSTLGRDAKRLLKKITENMKSMSGPLFITLQECGIIGHMNQKAMDQFAASIIWLIRTTDTTACDAYGALETLLEWYEDQPLTEIVAPRMKAVNAAVSRCSANVPLPDLFRMQMVKTDRLRSPLLDAILANNPIALRYMARRAMCQGIGLNQQARALSYALSRHRHHCVCVMMGEHFTISPGTIPVSVFNGVPNTWTSTELDGAFGALLSNIDSLIARKRIEPIIKTLAWKMGFSYALDNMDSGMPTVRCDNRGVAAALSFVKALWVHTHARVAAIALPKFRSLVDRLLVCLIHFGVWVRRNGSTLESAAFANAVSPNRKDRGPLRGEIMDDIELLFRMQSEFAKWDTPKHNDVIVGTIGIGIHFDVWLVQMVKSLAYFGSEILLKMRLIEPFGTIARSLLIHTDFAFVSPPTDTDIMDVPWGALLSTTRELEGGSSQECAKRLIRWCGIANNRHENNTLERAQAAHVLQHYATAIENGSELRKTAPDMDLDVTTPNEFSETMGRMCALVDGELGCIERYYTEFRGSDIQGAVLAMKPNHTPLFAYLMSIVGSDIDRALIKDTFSGMGTRTRHVIPYMPDLKVIEAMGGVDTTTGKVKRWVRPLMRGECEHIVWLG